jgi:hypothetical protein
MVSAMSLEVIFVIPVSVLFSLNWLRLVQWVRYRGRVCDPMGLLIFDDKIAELKQNMLKDRPESSLNLSLLVRSFLSVTR